MPSHLTHRAILGFSLAIFTSTVCVSAELKRETVNAWDAYINQENVKVKQRAQDEKTFFWVDAAAERLSRVRAGGVVVAPIGEHNPIKVPGALIHHWIAATFIPNAKVEDVLAITRDYAHYKDYFKPGVADGTTTSKGDLQDEFVLRFVNQSVLSKTSLEGTYVSEFVRVNDQRWYSTSVTSTMCEIKDFGSPKQKRFASDQGSGYIWRLYSTARLENRDGGVLLELEAIALSRDIPGALHWFVDPIVRRVSRESIEKSLAETSTATEERLKNCAAGDQIIKSGSCSQDADHSDIRTQRLSGNAGR